MLMWVLVSVNIPLQSLLRQSKCRVSVHTCYCIWNSDCDCIIHVVTIVIKQNELCDQAITLVHYLGYCVWSPYHLRYHPTSRTVPSHGLNRSRIILQKLNSQSDFKVTDDLDFCTELCQGSLHSRIKCAFTMRKMTS